MAIKRTDGPSGPTFVTPEAETHAPKTQTSEAKPAKAPVKTASPQAKTHTPERDKIDSRAQQAAPDKTAQAIVPTQVRAPGKPSGTWERALSSMLVRDKRPMASAIRALTDEERTEEEIEAIASFNDRVQGAFEDS